MAHHNADAANLISSGATEAERDAVELEMDDSPLEWLVAPAPAPTVEERFGQAMLRLRLYRGWSQRDLERGSGVHQSQISRLETGRQHGMSSRRMFAILRALRVGEIAFLPPPTVPRTALEPMLHGDPWERAGRVAQQRVSRRRSA